VRRDVAYDARQLSTGDTTICDASEDVAWLAAAGTLAAVEAVLSGQVNHAFALVRPPGHHAEADRGMGFCIFNNVALGARHAQVVHGLERVLIIDWDLHHGNGTQAIFWRNPSVLFASVHEWGNYPGRGAATERGEGPARSSGLDGASLSLPGACRQGVTLRLPRSEGWFNVGEPPISCIPLTDLLVCVQGWLHAVARLMQTGDQLIHLGCRAREAVPEQHRGTAVPPHREGKGIDGATL
jgi:hypothetical protein